ncbi:hypothetical protein SPONN_2231 [uncultured Candidatus Thioglobus sp.]|nr:hypothetical protein SPONN_2231 [uncultured Candidatus Thioglobus sp.]
MQVEIVDALVIPPDLSEIILAGLPIDDKFSSKIDKFLSGELAGLALKKWKDKWDKE